MKNLAIQGNNLASLDIEAGKAVGLTGTTLFRMQNDVHKVGEERIPTAVSSAWERELSLARGSARRGGKMATRIRVKSNSQRSKTDIIDGVVLHFDRDGYASILEAEAYKIEAYMARRPGRLQLLREEVPNLSDLLAAATEALAAEESPEEVAATEPQPVVPPEVASEEEAAKELGLDLSQVEPEDVPEKETKKQPKKKATKKE